MRLRDLTCAFCLSERSALRFDRKGRPYFTCGACGARSFLPALREAVRHLALVEPLLHARVEQLALDPADASRAVEREAAVSSSFAALLRAPAPGAPTAGTTETDLGALQRSAR